MDIVEMAKMVMMIKIYGNSWYIHRYNTDTIILNNNTDIKIINSTQKWKGKGEYQVYNLLKIIIKIRIITIKIKIIMILIFNKNCHYWINYRKYKIC